MVVEEATPPIAATEQPAPDSPPAPEQAGTSPSQAQEATPPPEPPAKEEASPPKKSLRQLIEEDEDYRREYQTEVNRRFQQELARWKRDREKEALQRAKDDPTAALEFAQSKAKEIEEEEGRLSAAQQRYQDAQEILAYHAADKDWAAEYNAWLEENRADANSRYARDPIAYMRYANARVIERMVKARAAKQAQEIAAALAEQKAKEALQNIPQPPTAPVTGGAALSFRTEQEVRNALAEDKITPREARAHLRRLGAL